jgi:hypothetical protein
LRLGRIRRGGTQPRRWPPLLNHAGDYFCSHWKLLTTLGLFIEGFERDLGLDAGRKSQGVLDSQPISGLRHTMKTEKFSLSGAAGKLGRFMHPRDGTLLANCKANPIDRSGGEATAPKSCSGLDWSALAVQVTRMGIKGGWKGMIVASSSISADGRKGCKPVDGSGFDRPEPLGLRS